MFFTLRHWPKEPWAYDDPRNLLGHWDHVHWTGTKGPRPMSQELQGLGARGMHLEDNWPKGLRNMGPRGHAF